MHSIGGDGGNAKPWEESFRRQVHMPNSVPSGSGPPLTSLSAGTSAGPPVPPRRDAQLATPNLGLNSTYGVGGFANNFSPYSFGNVGMMGGFGGLGGFGSPQNGVLSQHVESSLRPAFDSIHSVVQTVSSVAVMLESTYFALFNSVRALTGVADHLGNMAAQLRSLLTSLRLFRLLKYLCRRLAYLIGLTDYAPSENLWETLRHLPPPSAVAQAAGGQRPAAINWPLALFFVMSLGGPVLLWRFVSSFMPKSAADDDKWAEGQGEHYVARAMYAYAATRNDELTVKAGEALRVAPKQEQLRRNTPDGWLLAATVEAGMLFKNAVQAAA